METVPWEFLTEAEHFTADRICECDECHDDTETTEVTDPYDGSVWDICEECWNNRNGV